MSDIFYSDRIEVRTGELPFEVEFDGDPAGLTPCIIRPAEEPLRLICV